jgi:hypothetical protein
MTTFKINLKEDLDFKNIREPKILKLKKLQEEAIKRAQAVSAPPNVVIACALKFSISGSNVDRMVPIKYKGKEYDRNWVTNTFKFSRGASAGENDLTVSRFCACFANEIGEYLSLHPNDVRLEVTNVPPKLSFPHNYYIDNLDKDSRDLCILWLTEHDKVMNLALSGKWRSLAQKATAYFLKKYND